MARYMSIKYPGKNSVHQRKGKQGDKNRKKGDDPKSKDKDNNVAGVAGAHVRDDTIPEDSTARSSIGAHVSEATKLPSRPTRFVDNRLGNIPLMLLFGVGLTYMTCQLTQQTAKK